MGWQQRLDRRFADRYDRMTAPAERGALGAARRRLLAGVSGDVVEVGPGTGANRDHYPAGLRSLTLAEPSPDMRVHLERRYAGFAPTPRIVDDGAEDLRSVPDASVDVVVATMVLCSVRDLDAATREMARVLRPGGRLLLVEHVRGTGAWGRLQDAVTPLTVRFAAGCRHDRDPLAALRAAGFDVSGVHELDEPIAPLVRPAIAGTAIR